MALSRHQTILAVAAEQEQEWLELLRTIVDIDSGPGDHAGIGQVYTILAGVFEELGFGIETLPTPGPDVLVARRPGANQGSSRLALIGHADTVFPKGTAGERPFAGERERITGPGVADLKGGLVVVLAGLRLAGSAVLDRLDLTGGSRPNIVPEHARLRVDSRFDHDEAERAVVAGVEALAGPGPLAGTTTTVTPLDRRPAFPERSAKARLKEHLLATGEDLGLSLVGEATGGSSDSNFTSAAGVPTIDGLGAVGHDYHTSDEYVLVGSIAQRATLFASLLHRIGEDGV
ncbi:MAG TPA: M20/M25/M40 family metallo-hydrolase [Acidimicrobiia bacterium]|nr:M20/M25/M40 family metallo-hydrolase [Acidimicrobiia bacterium]